MTSKSETNRMNVRELDAKINDCRIRILKELGIDVPKSLKEGVHHESD